MTRMLGRSLLKALIAMTLIGVAFVYVANHGPEQIAQDTTSYGEVVVAEHHCVDPVKGALPTGAVMTLNTWAEARYTEDPALVGQAMEHALAGVDNDVWSVTAFCA